MNEGIAAVGGLMFLFGIFLVILWICIPFLIWGVSSRLNRVIQRHDETIRGLKKMLKENGEQNEKLLKAIGRLPRAKYHQPDEDGDDDGFVSGRGEQHVAK